MANGILAASQIQMESLSGTGVITVVPPATNINRTLTLPDVTGNVAVNGPIFSARPTANQTITTSTWTKINFGTENYDSASCYDASTSVFTPNVAGYYLISIVFGAATTVTLLGLLLRKNGADFRYGSVITGSGSACAASWSGLVYMDGLTDYLEVSGYLTGTTPQVSSLTTNTVFEGLLVRTA
jgi:hypothetical protein